MIATCLHSDCAMMLGAKGKGIAQWCKDCGAHNPGEGCDWQFPRFKLVDCNSRDGGACEQDECDHLEMGSVGSNRYCRRCNVPERDMPASQEIRQRLEMAHERIEDLQNRLVKERVEHGETFLRAKKSDDMLRDIKLAMPHVEAGYDSFDAKVKKLETELEECGDAIKRQTEEVNYYRQERDRLLNEHQDAITELNELRQSIGGGVHRIDSCRSEMQARHLKMSRLTAQLWRIVNGVDESSKVDDAS